MELRQLRYLVALADEGHFTRAAARERIAQPALSKQIARLEAELGIALVERSSRRVALTDAGARFVVRARRVLDEVGAALDEVHALRGLTTGRLAVGVLATAGAVDVPGLLIEFRRQHPNVELAVREGLSVELARQLRTGDLDVALITVATPGQGEGLELSLLAQQPLALWVGVGHRLAERKRVRIAELRDEAFAVFHRGATIRDLVERAALRHGFAPRVAYEFADAGKALSILSDDLTVTVLPRTQPPPAGAAIVPIRLTEPALDHRVYLAHRPGSRASPATAAFLELVRERARR